LVHTYADTPAGTDGHVTATVTVADAEGAKVTAATALTVRNLAPVLAPLVGPWITDTGLPFRASGSFSDSGAETWTGTVDYGDGSGVRALFLSADHRFTLDHDYASEGTYTVAVHVRDDDGAESVVSQRVTVFLAGTTDIHVIEVVPGTSGTVTTGGIVATLANVRPADAATMVLVGIVSLDAIRNLNGSPTNDPTLQVLAFDVRVLNPNPNGALNVTVQFDPLRLPGVAPQLLYFDSRLGTFRSVRDSATGTFAVDPTSGTVTFRLDANSAPALSLLNGTLFALAVPTAGPAPTPSPRAASPFMVFAESSGTTFGLTSDASTLPRSAAATTGLVSSSGLTVSLAAADGLRRDGASRGSAAAALNPQVLTRLLRVILGIRDALVEVFRMWHDEPLPLVSPIDPAKLTDLDGRVPDDNQVIPLPAQAAAPPVIDDVAPANVPVVVPAECQFEVKPASAEPVVARAETHPWWLESDRNGPQEVSAETPHEPTTADKAAALVTALWLGGLALKVSAPDPEVEEEPPQPGDPSKKNGEKQR
jgi:hypothetical protein